MDIKSALRKVEENRRQFVKFAEENHVTSATCSAALTCVGIVTIVSFAHASELQEMAARGLVVNGSPVMAAWHSLLENAPKSLDAVIAVAKGDGPTSQRLLMTGVVSTVLGATGCAASAVRNLCTSDKNPVTDTRRLIEKLSPEDQQAHRRELMKRVVDKAQADNARMDAIVNKTGRTAGRKYGNLSPSI